MSEILVAIICNLVAGLILISGVLTSLRCGWKVSLIKLFLTLGAGVGTFFLSPFLSDKLWWEVKGLSTLAAELGISQVTINSCIFLILFLLFFGLVSIICSIVKHSLIKNMQRSVSENRAKIKRAKSINPRAEKAARRTIWKELKNEYKSANGGFKKVISSFVGLIIYVLVGFTMLLPLNYIATDLNKANDNKYEYLEKGYEYTLNGVLGDEVLDFIVTAPEV